VTTGADRGQFAAEGAGWVSGATLGAYRLEAAIGAGAMGTVWRASGPHGVVAVKIAHPQFVGNASLRRRFDREAAIGLSVRHANVVRTFAALLVPGEGGAQVPAIVMEFVEGRSLRDLLAEMRRLPEDLCRHLGREIARGLDALHAAGVVHRDLKPGNVMVTPANEVKVMDFGLARPEVDDRLTSHGEFVGTPCYAAPEQIRSERVDARSDLYSLGATLYELATGVPPLDGRDVAAWAHGASTVRVRPAGRINPQLSPFFEELLTKLLSREPQGRFASAREIGEVLDAGEHAPWWSERATRVAGAISPAPRRVRIPRETELVGREPDLAALRALFEAAKSGDGRVVLLEGEAGVGKSRLVEEFLAALDAAGEQFHALVGGFPPAGAATGSGAFVSAYREHFDAERGVDALRRHLTETPLLFPAFAALLRGEPTPPGAEPLTKDSLQTMFVHATRALAGERPTVVFIDDLQFAPQDGRALFAALAYAAPGLRVLLVGASRPGLPADWTAQLERLDHVRKRVLARLDESAVAALLARALGAGPAAARLARRVAATAGGNAYFLVELLRSLRERGVLDGAADAAAEVAIPASIRDLVGARVAALAAEDRTLLETAACCGHEFDGRAVADALGRPRLDALRRLGALEREHQVVRAAGPRFVFDHHLVGETLLAGMSDALREETHFAIADALERAATATGAPRDGAHAAQMAGHFLRGAAPARAARYVEPAMAHFEKSWLNEDAVRFADLALAAPGGVEGRARCELLMRKATRLDLLGRPADERDAASAAVAVADEVGDATLRARARVTLGSHLVRTSAHEQATSLLVEALSLARAAGDRAVEALAVGARGAQLIQLGRFEDAIVHDREWLALVRETGDRHGETVALGNLGNVLLHVGRFEEALVHQDRCLALARETGDLRSEATALGGVGIVCDALGRLEQGSAYTEQWIELSRRIGHRHGEAIATGNLGGTRHSLGRLGEARDLYVRSAALSREIGRPQAEAIALVNLGPIEAALGDFDEARRRLDAALSLARAIGDVRIEGYALQGLGAVAFTAGDADAATRDMEAALALRRRIGHAPGVAETLLALAAAHAESGRSDDARRACAEALEVARSFAASDVAARVLCRAASLDLRDAAAAEAELAEHEARVPWPERMECRFLLARATGDVAHLRHAKLLLDHLVEHAPAERRDAMLTRVPLHRAIIAAAARGSTS
jgi:tetratricopeptide (TPR) repeat protein